ncbi:hypothetical protein PPERSA_09269 [Pseudocohnilembus persalinus]|uniref:Uncharacterized protein n=1 Tax=Pseudocohnilembus persalinus TaxID=266149 RepID=A0A0V0QLM8_PSEPJ|nr:hypothetical protein PPERSA_09269 [Pseudocohnilembus persalinus]|eukprot:KRX03257.1 hypothetical protein PPERSA_09269 [Pseudocohnilembus persalinus]
MHQNQESKVQQLKIISQTHVNEYVAACNAYFHNNEIIELYATSEEIHLLILVCEKLKNIGMADYYKLNTNSQPIKITNSDNQHQKNKNTTLITSQMKRLKHFNEKYIEHFEEQQKLQAQINQQHHHH